jgi:uncharacterized protein
MKNQDWIKGIVYADPWMMHVLQVVRDLNLPDSWVGAGFVRNKVWDVLHDKKTPLTDVDVIYFDKSNIDESVEKDIENQLKEIDNTVPWSVKNQARMHIKNGDEPYSSSEHALSQWIETPTCIGIRLNNNNELELIAPHGIDDLVNLIVRPAPIKRNQQDLSFYRHRVEGKGWKEIWPELTIIFE